MKSLVIPFSVSSPFKTLSNMSAPGQEHGHLQDSDLRDLPAGPPLHPLPPVPRHRQRHREQQHVHPHRPQPRQHRLQHLPPLVPLPQPGGGGVHKEEEPSGIGATAEDV